MLNNIFLKNQHLLLKQCLDYGCIEDSHDTDLKYRGIRNQRVIRIITSE